MLPQTEVYLGHVFKKYIVQSLIFNHIQVSAAVALAPPQLRLRRRRRVAAPSATNATTVLALPFTRTLLLRSSNNARAALI